MKALVTLSMTLLLSSLHAQSLSAGGAFVYGDDIEEFGINFRSYYNLPDERFCFGPELTFFRDHEEEHDGETLTKSLWEVNLNGHFIFELSEKWGIYPLTGLNVSIESERSPDINGELTETKLGLNLGGGIHRVAGPVVIFAEYDHLVSVLNQNTLTLGLFYTFEGSSKGH